MHEAHIEEIFKPMKHYFYSNQLSKPIKVRSETKKLIHMHFSTLKLAMRPIVIKLSQVAIAIVANIFRFLKYKD